LPSGKVVGQFEYPQSRLAGYLYFPLSKKTKNARYELENMLNGNKIVLRLPE
jgi:hypothetical protein